MPVFSGASRRAGLGGFFIAHMKFPRLSDYERTENEEAYQARVAKVKAEECRHTKTEYRRKICVNGTTQIRSQCIDCGFTYSGSVAKSQCPPEHLLSDVDEDAAKVASSLSHNKLMALHEQAKLERRHEWFRMYDAYLQSDEWKERRRLVFVRDNYICQGCLTCRAEQVHHLSYANVGEELLFELMSICKQCHDRIHCDNEESDK